MRYVVTVVFEIALPHLDPFMAQMRQNASQSLHAEPGCRQFDVCFDADRPARVFLYEVYDDRAAFDAHLASPHFKSFDAAVAAWIESKHVAFYLRAD